MLNYAALVLGNLCTIEWHRPLSVSNLGLTPVARPPLGPRLVVIVKIKRVEETLCVRPGAPWEKAGWDTKMVDGGSR